jgi:hypothetical protein
VKLQTAEGPSFDDHVGAGVLAEDYSITFSNVFLKFRVGPYRYYFT